MLSEDEEQSMFNDLFIYVFIGGMFLLVLLIMAIFMLFKRFKAKIKEKYQQIKKKTFFNGIIRSIMLSFLKTSLASGI